MLAESSVRHRRINDSRTLAVVTNDENSALVEIRSCGGYLAVCKAAL